MNVFLAQVLLSAAVGVVSGYPSYQQDGRFYYQVPLETSHAHLLSGLTPAQQHFVQRADPFGNQLYQQPYLQLAGLGLQDGKKRPTVGQQQLLGQQLLGQHQVLYFGKDSSTEEGGGGGGGGYVDSFLGMLGSYWPGQGSPDNSLPTVKPPVSGGEETSTPSGSEGKPETTEAAPAGGAAAALPSAERGKYMLAPAIRAPPQMFIPQQAHLSDFHREMFDGGLGGKAGSGALSFHKMLAAAKLKAAQAGVKAAMAEQEAQSVSAEDGKDDTGDGKEPSEQEQFGPSIAQAKPQAVSVAGMGGVAAAAPVGTAVVGPGGMALSAPHATAVAGASRRPQLQDDKLTRLSNRVQANIPPASYFLRY